MADGEFIRNYRKKLRLTQAEFAEKFDIPLGTLRLWERDRSRTPDHLIKLLKERDELLSTINKLDKENKKLRDVIIYQTAMESFFKSDLNPFKEEYVHENESDVESKQMSLFDLVQEDPNAKQ